MKLQWIFFYKTLKFIELDKYSPEIYWEFIFILKKYARRDLEVNCNFTIDLIFKL